MVTCRSRLVVLIPMEDLKGTSKVMLLPLFDQSCCLTVHRIIFIRIFQQIDKDFDPVSCSQQSTRLFMSFFANVSTCTIYIWMEKAIRLTYFNNWQSLRIVLRKLHGDDKGSGMKRCVNLNKHQSTSIYTRIIHKFPCEEFTTFQYYGGFYQIYLS